MTNQFRNHWSALLTAVALAACTSVPRVQTQQAPGVDVTHYDRFAFYAPLETDVEGYETILSTRLKAATRAELEAKGYRYDESSPRVLVNFAVSTRPASGSNVRVMPSIGIGSWGSSGGVSVGVGGDVDPGGGLEGVVHIDLVDPEQQVMIWGGIGKMEAQDPERWSAEELALRVREIIAEIPPVNP